MSDADPVVQTYCNFCEDNVEFQITPHIREQAVNLKVNLPCPDCYRLCTVTIPPSTRPTIPEGNSILGPNPLSWLMPFVNMDTVMPGVSENDGNNTLLSMARAQAGLDVEQWITDMLSQQEKKPTSKQYLAQLFSDHTITIRPKHLRQLCLAVDGLNTLIYPHAGGFGADVYATNTDVKTDISTPMSPTPMSPTRASLSTQSDVSIVADSEIHLPSTHTLNVHSLPRGPHTWLCKRGEVSFAKKASLVQQYGGVCVVVGQVGGEWPYVMTDSSGSTSVSIPCVMVRESDYDLLVKHINTHTTTTPSSPPHPRVCVFTRPRPLSCAICVEDLCLGDHVIDLPCSHKFHQQCLEPWLTTQHTCPVCRHELPQEAPVAPKNNTSEEVILWS